MRRENLRFRRPRPLQDILPEVRNPAPASPRSFRRSRQWSDCSPNNTATTPPCCPPSFWRARRDLRARQAAPDHGPRPAAPRARRRPPGRDPRHGSSPRPFYCSAAVNRRYVGTPGVLPRLPPRSPHRARPRAPPQRPTAHPGLTPAVWRSLPRVRTPARVPPRLLAI